MEASILVNGRFWTRRITGVERYAREVTQRLIGRVRLVTPGWGKFAGGLLGQIWEQLILPVRVRRDDLLWSPANSAPLLVTNQVVTIHDLSPLENPEWYEPRYATWYRFMIPRLARKARRIITDSDFVRLRVVQRTGVSPGSVVVIPPGVDTLTFHPRSPQEVERTRLVYALPVRYILAVGSPSPRKNLQRLFEAWELVHRAHPDLGLVIIGTPAHTGRRLPPRPDQVGVRWLGAVPDRDLPAVYSGALALAMPSLYEGFGLPVLEAMACGTPVLASNITALPEVVGPAGLLVDPNRVEGIAVALGRLVAEPALRADLSQSGLKRARRFSWDQTAARVWDVLLESAGSGRGRAHDNWVSKSDREQGGEK